ncbi:MAG TPA: hypothetical protein PKD53_34495, partial [Chloroflexaceae bacterium]|nr:hypothetical protein [Chloroflexaceae bacterium]
MKAAPVSYEYHIVVGPPGEARLLLLPGPEGWRLPGFSDGARRFWQDVDHVNAWLRQGLGAPATTLRCLAIGYSPDDELISKVYAAARRPESIDLPGVEPLQLDITDPDSVRRAAELATDVNVVINNAG